MPVGSGDPDLETALDLFFHDAFDGDSVLPGLFEVLSGRVAGDSRREDPLAMPRGEEVGLDRVPFLHCQLSLLVEELVFLDDALSLSTQVDEISIPS